MSMTEPPLSPACRNPFRAACLLLMVVACLPARGVADSPRSASLKPFLSQYCLRCHGERQQKGERRFDGLASTIAADDTLIDYQDILDQLNLAEMPPEDATQPTDEERRAIVELLTTRIERFHQSRQALTRAPVLRRLNAREYHNTVRDLFELDLSIFQPTVSFPRDETVEHLDNVGSALVTSSHLLARYLEAAEQVVEKALTPLEKPQVQTWTFRNGFKQQPEIDQVHRTTNRFEHMTLYEVVGADKHEGAYGPILAFAEGVPFDGHYIIRLRAEALHREHPYDPKFLGTDPSEPLRLGIVAGDHTAGNLHLPQPNEPQLAELDLADGIGDYEVRVWLDKGITPRFTFPNGSMDVRNLWSRLLKKYPDQFPKGIKRGIVAARFNAIKFGKLPQIHLHEIEIEGPLYEAWPTPSHEALLGEEWGTAQRTGEIADHELRQHLQRLMSRAYRRPAGDEEVDRIAQLIRARRNSGRSLLEAYGDGIQAMLCSPHFLYLEPAAENGLTAYGVASRLSYFLWSTMPDQELFDLADRQELLEPQVLAQQVDRMLADPKSDAFIEGFLQSWLALRDLGSMPPDRQAFGPYYHYHLDSAMRRETHLFVRHLIDENLPIDHFLDSEFTFVNRALARHYGIEPPNGIGFHKVTLDDRRRGGLLGQASVLTVTANGIDTSPVVRGVWLLENLLGTPPSPPPPDVEPLDPDVRGATSIRDQLDKHRQVATCNECHRRIDPLGFALENFDPIGRWRDRYRPGVTVDASGELPGGKRFDDVAGLKRILVEQQDRFARALTQKLAAYAIGRQLGPRDRRAIDEILKAAGEREGLRDLIRAVVLSDLFQS